jgi:hypothetical protein
MAKKIASKYSPAMVAAIEASAPLDLGKATALASKPDFVAAGVTPRGVVMKALTLGVDYVKAVKVTKSGEAVMAKADMAAAIGEALGLDVASLANAEKADLRAVLTAVQALARVDA